MTKVLTLKVIKTIKPRPGTGLLADGTIADPVPCELARVLFVDGIEVVVERPLTTAQLRKAYKAAQDVLGPGIDEVVPGQDI